MKAKEFQQRVLQRLEEEKQDPERWMYLSFADEEFKGAVITKAHGMTHAMMFCHAVGINPGGQVMAGYIPDDHLPPENYRNRLLSKEEIKEFWPDAKSLKEFD